ncbi:MAG: transposase [Candidatus Bathyarchaeia archaeon]
MPASWTIGGLGICVRNPYFSQGKVGGCQPSRENNLKGTIHAGWGQLLFTSYKAEEAGKSVEAVDPYGTTRDCSRCGFHVPKNLSERIHECPKCGLTIDRDLNAARNILKKVGWGTAESTRAEIKPLLQQPVVVKQAGSRNQEAHEL